MHLRYKFRLYPDRRQREELARTFGCVRVVYNDALQAREDAYKQGLPFPKTNDLAKVLITQAKRTPERAWLADAPVSVLQQALRDLDVAYRGFCNSLNGKRKGSKQGKPRFRSRKEGWQSARYTRSTAFRVLDDGKLRLPRVGAVRVKWSRQLPASPSSVTVIKDAAGRYFASFSIQTDADERLPEVDQELGIDLGLTHFAVLSDGRKISSPKFLRRTERKLRRAQKELARKEKGSNNRAKSATRVARIHGRIADARRDHHHKLSTQIIRENQAVYVENLSVKGLGRTRLAKSVYDAGWAKFVAMLEYKAARYGRTFGRVDRWLPSSQTCHVCFVIDGPKPLNVRTWVCGACQTVHDRDENAAKVILAVGQTDRLNACGAAVSPSV